MKRKYKICSNLQICIDNTSVSILLWKKLQKLELKSDICPICMDKSTVITKCGHLFCAECIKKHVNTYNFCPNCRNESNRDDLYSIANIYENSKIDAICSYAKAINAEPIMIVAQYKNTERFEISVCGFNYTMYSF